MSERAPITKLDGWYVGEDQDFQWTVYSEDRETQEDITGWTIEFRMALSASGASVLTRPAVLDNDIGGVCHIDVSAADTQSLAPRKYWYTLSRIDSGFNQVLADGPAWLQARVL